MAQPHPFSVRELRGARAAAPTLAEGLLRESPLLLFCLGDMELKPEMSTLNGASQSLKQHFVNDVEHVLKISS